MTHRTFTKTFDEGEINVSVNLEFDGKDVHIAHISVHSNFNSGLPHHPILVGDGHSWSLVAQYVKEGVGPVREAIKSKYSDEIVSEILSIKEQETPKFDQ